MSRLFALLVAAVVAVPSSSLAVESESDSPFTVRLRSVYIDPANKSDAGGGLAKDAIHVSEKLIPEVDFTYAFSKYFAAELILSYPQEHNVNVVGLGKVGTFSHLPPVVTMQAGYPVSIFRPYVGAGLNFTWITSQDLAGGDLKLDKTSFGFAGQAGCDVQITRRLSLNADVKYVTLGLDLNTRAGDKVTSLDVNPWLFGGGLAYRF